MSSVAIERLSSAKCPAQCEWKFRMAISIGFLSSFRQYKWLVLPSVSQGEFWYEQISTPVSSMAWSWWVPCRPDCQWQKFVRVWSAWWSTTKPGWNKARNGHKLITSKINTMQGFSVFMVISSYKKSQDSKVNAQLTFCLNPPHPLLEI